LNRRYTDGVKSEKADAKVSDRKKYKIVIFSWFNIELEET